MSIFNLPTFRQKLKQLLENKLVRFFLVSGVNTAFGYGLFALFLFIGIRYPLALLMSTVSGILFNFKTIGVLVFRSSDNLLLFKFFAVYGVTYLFNLGGLAALKSFNVSAYVGGAILLIPIGLLAFLLNQKFVFKD